MFAVVLQGCWVLAGGLAGVGAAALGQGRPEGSLEMGLQPEQGGHPTGLGNHVCWAVCPSVLCSPGGEAWTFASRRFCVP